MAYKLPTKPGLKPPLGIANVPCNVEPPFTGDLITFNINKYTRTKSNTVVIGRSRQSFKRDFSVWINIREES